MVTITDQGYRSGVALFRQILPKNFYQSIAQIVSYSRGRILVNFDIYRVYQNALEFPTKLYGQLKQTPV